MEPTTAIQCPKCGGELEQLDAETRFQAFAANPAGRHLDVWDRRDRREPGRRKGFFGDLVD